MSTAGTDVMKRTDSCANRMREYAHDSERQKEAEGCEKETLAPRLSEVPIVDLVKCAR